LFTVKIDDSQLQKFLRESPKRANWALSEAIKSAGGHWRKEFIKFIESAGSGLWAPLRPMTKAIKEAGGFEGKEATSPLYFLRKMISFKFTSPKGKPQVDIGLFMMRRTRKKEKLQTAYAIDSDGNPIGHKYTTKSVKQKREYFKKYFGMTSGMFLKRLEQGWTRRVTKQSRKYHAAIGFPMKKGTTTIHTPARPLRDPIYNRDSAKIPGYVADKFFKIFFSNKKQGLKF
jgi:hypothetical protein